MIKFIELPKLAVNMDKGKITKWLKQVGEQTLQGEPLVEVATGKINVQMDSPFTGKLVEILAPEGSEVLVGAKIGALEVAETQPQTSFEATDKEASRTAHGEAPHEDPHGAQGEESHGAPSGTAHAAHGEDPHEEPNRAQGEESHGAPSGTAHAAHGEDPPGTIVTSTEAIKTPPGTMVTSPGAAETPPGTIVTSPGATGQPPKQPRTEMGKNVANPQSNDTTSGEKHYDVVIIGGGPGGYVAAIRVAQLGGKVALVERDSLGGTCLNRGCIPSKTMIKSASLYTAAKNSAEFGVESSDLKVNFPRIMERKDAVVAQLRVGVEQLMRDNGIAVYRGTGRLTGKNQVTVALAGDRIRMTAKDIIIASGSLPAGLPVPGVDLPEVLNSDTVFEVDQIPESLVIIGGGYIAIEMGCFFNAIGAKVTIIEMLPRILPFADKEISDELTGILLGRGISIHADTKVENIVPVEGGGLAILASNIDGKEKLFYCKKVLNATGRVCNSDGLGLSALGIKKNGGAIAVNERMQTNISNIYAIGDVTGKVMLAHVASNQGIVAAENIMGRGMEVDYSVIPSVVFANPEIGHTGLTEEEANKQNLQYTINRFPFAALGKALASGETRGLCKLIVSTKTGAILGAHILGPGATDLIATIAVSMKNGVTVKQLAQTIFAHPTLAEIISETANVAMGTPIHLSGGK